MTTQTSFENGRLTVTRVYDAPREAVFDAWIETSKVEQWWGCAQTVKVKSEVEPKLGGKYMHMMTIEGVGDHSAGGILTEYDPPALLAYDMQGPMPGSVSKVRVEFIEHGAKTEVRLTHDNLPDEFSDIVSGGWSAAFGKLETFLQSEAAAA